MKFTADGFDFCRLPVDKYQYMEYKTDTNPTFLRLLRYLELRLEMNVTTSEVLEVAELTKEFDQRKAVNGISFAVGAGEIYGLLGPNGAGKTTTIGMIASIVPPTSGRVHITGHSIASSPELIGRYVGFVPQSLSLYPSLTAEENLRFFGRVYEVQAKKLSNRIESLLELTGLSLRRADPVSTFSGGMKRRLNLACGLVHQPKLLLLDEPTVGVDPQSPRSAGDGSGAVAELEVDHAEAAAALQHGGWTKRAEDPLLA